MTRPNVNWAQGWPGEEAAADLGEGGRRDQGDSAF